MDPLSVTASVVGLVSAAAQLTTLLYNLGSEFKDAPRLTGAAVSELNDISHVLLQLQRYIDGKTPASLSRLSLITVEHITASLTGCVITYSELDALLKSLHAGSSMKVWDRAVWIIKKDEVNAVIGRLQNHKSSFTLMLNIIQCSSMGEAERSMDDLCDKVSQLLLSNQELSMRLRNIEDGYSTRNAGRYVAVEGASADAANDAASTTTASSIDEPDPAHVPGRPSGEATAPHPSAFEELLHRSRVYRHADRRHSESSFSDDGRSTLAISICSSLTLGEVSRISVYALPVYAMELSNPEYYQFGVTVAASSAPDGLKHGLTTSGPAGQKQPRDREHDQRALSYWWANFKKTPATPTSTVPAPVVFGVALATSVRYANVAISLCAENGDKFVYGYIPITVARCGIYLKEKAAEVERIFEIAGNPKHIKEISVAFDVPPRYGKGLNWEGYSVHDAGSVLLRYLLMLPEPLVPLDMYGRFRGPLAHPDLADTSNQDDTIRSYRTLVTELPPLQRQLLLYLLDLLAVFASKSDVNKMTTTKLAAIFQPGILAHPLHQNTPAQYRLDQDVLIFLIENQDNFLIGMDTPQN